MILVFILFSFLPLFWPFLMPHRENHFWLFTEVVRKIPGEVTRKSDGPRVKTTARGVRAF